MSFNPNSSYGRAVLSTVQAAVPTFGNIFIVKNANDSADDSFTLIDQVFPADSEGQIRVFTDLATAYGQVLSNNNDVIVLAAHTSHKVSSMLTVAKNRVHFIGLDGGGHIEDQRTMISNTGAGASTDIAMVRVTGTGVTFRNIKFANNWTVSQNLYAVDDQGSQGLFINCTIQNLGSAHLTNNAAASLRVSSDTTLYRDCTLGQDTLKVTSTGGQQVLFKAGADGGATAAHRVSFINSIFESYTSDTTHVFIRVNATGDIDRFVNLVNPVFNNFNFDASNGGAQLAVCIATPASLVSGGFHIINPAFLFATKLATAAVGNAGVYVSCNTQPTAASAAAIKATT